MVAIVPTPDAYWLIHEGAKALAQVEAAGMRVDLGYVAEAVKDCEFQINRGNSALQQSEVWERWRRRFGDTTNIDSDEQITAIFFDELGFECERRGKPSKVHPKGRPVFDEEEFDKIDHPFIKEWGELKKLKKVSGTYLNSLVRETSGGFIHPFFNLHTTKTFRSSSQDPNFQNIPIRDPRIAKIIRQCFVPRDGHQLVEMDFGAIEVRAAAWYHKDPTMLDYLEQGYDLHSDMAAQVFLLPKSEITKPLRHLGKNGFVFPEFYGAWYKSVCKQLWNESAGLTTSSGVPVHQHLASKGIHALGSCSYKKDPAAGTYELHISEVENHFWKKRFPVYTQWKESFFDEYLRLGGFMNLTGFAFNGVYTRKEVINYPVQSVGFHCLLWTLIQMQRHINKYQWKSRIVGQIHDSIVADVHQSEVQDFLAVAGWFMRHAIRKFWPWIITKLEVEAEAAPIGQSWYYKTKIDIPELAA